MSDYSPHALREAIDELRRRDAVRELPGELRMLVDRIESLADYCLDTLGVDLWDELTGVRRADETVLRMLEAEIHAQGWTVEAVLDAVMAMVAVGIEVAGVAVKLASLAAIVA